MAAVNANAGSAQGGITSSLCWIYAFCKAQSAEITRSVRKERRIACIRLAKGYGTVCAYRNSEPKGKGKGKGKGVK